MTFTSIIRTTARSAVLAGVVAVAATALPTPAVQAAPAPAAPAASAPARIASRTRQPDAIADLAVTALAALRNLAPGGSAAAGGDYLTKRNAVATAVAERLGLDPAPMIAAWERADLEHQTALLAGLTQMGVPYRRNSSKAGEGFDCSGLTTYAWGEAGFALTRQSSAQIRAAASRTPETAQAGDLVQYPGHVSMWLGVDRAMLHSPYTGKYVEVHLQKKRSLKYGDPTETA